MKKKLSVLFISLLLCIGYVNAESANDRVTIVSQPATTVGYHWIASYGPKQVYEITNYNYDTNTYRGLSAAKAACKKATGSSDSSACSYKIVDQKYKCDLDGAKNLKPEACRTYKAKGTTCSASGNQWLCKLSGKKFANRNTCNQACLNYTRSCNSSCSADQDNTTYKIGVNYSNSSTGGSYTDKIQPSTIWHYLLKSKSGTVDNAFCLQPGKRGPHGTQYCLNKEVNLSDCDDKLQKHYYCGLAQILYYTMTPSNAADGSVTYVDNGKYGFGSITTALRMWASYYGKIKGNAISGLNEIGLENGEFDYYTNTPVYLNTAIAASKGYKGNDCAENKNANNLGVLCGDVGNNHSYKLSIELFNKALAMFNGKGGKFLDGMLGGTDNGFKINTTKNNIGGATMTAAWPKTFVEQSTTSSVTSKQYKLECTKEEILNKNSACRIYTQVFVEKNGKKTLIPAGQIAANCTKEKCTVEVKGEKVCVVTTTSTTTNLKYTFEVTLKGYTSNGVIREYRNCASPNSYQIMLTAAFNKYRVEQTSKSTDSDQKFTRTVSVSCPCNDQTKCTNFGPSSKTLTDGGKASCGNNYDGYDKFDKSDPYMNCILNPCNTNDQKQFERDAGELGLNSDVCTVFCRKEVVFYLANKKTVYAGMQFRYDIGPALIACDDDVDTTVRTDVALTSIVLQKKQCTSEIYYDKPNKKGKTWLQMYDQAVKNMMKAYQNWKQKESIYSWEKSNGGPDKVQIPAVDCYRGTGCPGKCEKSRTLSAIDSYLYWPKKGSSQKYSYCTISSGTTKGVTFGLNCKKSGSYNISDGKLNQASGCQATSCNCETCGGGTDADGKPIPTYRCNCDYGQNTTGTCQAGRAGNPNLAKNGEATAYSAYKSKLDAVAQLIYDLQNCNMYVASGNTAPKIQDVYQSVSTSHHGTVAASINKSALGSAKNIMLKESVCDAANDECADMTLEYEDELYGKNVTIEKETKTLPSKNLNETYFCKNTSDANPDCYRYVKDEEVEIRKPNALVAHQLIQCSGDRTDAKCTNTGTINLPTNDFASFTIITETDFWRSDKFSASAYTGSVTQSDRGSGLSTPLGNEEYPVSNGLTTGGKTGNYSVKQHIENVKITTDDNVSLDYTCSYDVYNTTNLYDCATKTKDGKLDLSACKNSCYKLVAGVPVIKSECSNFDLKKGNSKGYGFTYRNVDLNDLFPNKTERPAGVNWSTTVGKEVIRKVEKKGTDIFTDDSNIKYSFVLTPTAINRIREYNTQQELKKVGYQDSSYLSCDLVKDKNSTNGLKGFYRCKSAFLDEISQPNNSYDIVTKKFSNPGEGGN